MNQTDTQRRTRLKKLPPLRERFAADAGAQAAYRLFELCWCHAGGSTAAIAAFLIGLYNKDYASGDPAWLCKWSDEATFEDVVSTMRWIRANSQYEIHHLFASDGGGTMLKLMERFGLWPQVHRED